MSGQMIDRHRVEKCCKNSFLPDHPLYISCDNCPYNWESVPAGEDPCMYGRSREDLERLGWRRNQ